MNPVSMMGGSLLMTQPNETAFANYFVKYIQAYAAAGVPIDYISLQNEPLNPTTAYPSMGMTDAQQLAVLQSTFYPRWPVIISPPRSLSGTTTGIRPSYPEYVLSGLTAQQLTQVAGTAWHGYGGAPGAQQIVQNAFPGSRHMGDRTLRRHLDQRSVLFRLCGDHRGAAQLRQVLCEVEPCAGPEFGTNLTQDAPPLGGCNTCTPIVTVNNTTGAVTKDIEYYTLGQYSKYVLPGAVRIYSSDTPAIASVAFQNPDGSTALIAYNVSTSSQSFQVQWGTQSFSYSLPALAAATFIWTGTQSGSTPPVEATAQIQGSSFSSESGLETETTGDTTGEYDLGYLSPGTYTVYQNVDFGTGVTEVSVRTASAGNGGTATFYLDSLTGTQVATVALPVTGGWQTWQTVTATASGASGVHDLYLVFTGGGASASIANVNWFQFQ